MSETYAPHCSRTPHISSYLLHLILPFGGGGGPFSLRWARPGNGPHRKVFLKVVRESSSDKLLLTMSFRKLTSSQKYQFHVLMMVVNN